MFVVVEGCYGNMTGQMTNI